MASLQDQLLQAGLVNEKKAKQAKKAQRKKTKQAHKSKQAPLDENKVAAQQALKDKAEKDRQLNLQQQEQAQQKAIAAQVKQLVTLNKLDRRDADIAYNFEHSAKFKKIYVNKKMQDMLSRGQLAIIALETANETQFEVVVKAVADKIAQRMQDAVIMLNHDNTETLSSEEEDWYADYEIPDDLMW